MSLSNVENWLTYHIRTWLSNTFHWTTIHNSTFVISLFACASAGLISLMPVYMVPWQLRLGYSSLNLNTIAAAMNMGLYMTPPILGLLADSHGPVLLTWLSLIGYVPSYLYLSYVFDNGEDLHFAVSVSMFVIVGVSTSALFFSAFITCAKLYPGKKFLSISFPTTCFGLASLVGLQVMKLPMFHFVGEDGKLSYLNLAVVFKVLALFYTVVFLLTWISTSTVSIIKLRGAQADPVASSANSERVPLVPGTDSDVPRKLDSDQLYIKIRQFLGDGIAHVFIVVMLLCLGVAEAFNTNMVSMTTLILGPGVSYNVLPQFAFSSTAARFLSGLAVDLFTKWQWPRAYILIFLLLVTILAQEVIIRAMVTGNVAYMSVASIISGFSSGGLFSVFPALTMNLWGDEVFGTAYGTFMLGPALGATIFGINYARVYDSRCQPESSSTCIIPAFRNCILALFVSVSIFCIAVVRSKRLRSA